MVLAAHPPKFTAFPDGVGFDLDPAHNRSPEQDYSADRAPVAGINIPVDHDASRIWYSHRYLEQRRSVMS